MTAGPGSSPTHYSRSSLKTLITKVPLGTAATFGKVDAKTYTEQRAPKLRRDPEGGQLGYTAPFKKCRGRFSRTYSPVSRCPCRHQRWTPLAPPEGRSSLTDTKDLPTFPNMLASRPGLPLRLSVTAKRRISTQGRSRLVAAWQGYRTLGEEHQLGPSLPSASTYNLVIP